MFLPELIIFYLNHFLRYAKILVQEFRLKLDSGFLLSLFDVYQSLFSPEKDVSGVWMFYYNYKLCTSVLIKSVHTICCLFEYYKFSDDFDFLKMYKRVVYKLSGIQK